jgi:hypothetical protein
MILKEHHPFATHHHIIGFASDLLPLQHMHIYLHSKGNRAAAPEDM